MNNMTRIYSKDFEEFFGSLERGDIFYFKPAEHGIIRPMIFLEDKGTRNSDDFYNVRVFNIIVDGLSSYGASTYGFYMKRDDNLPWSIWKQADEE